jgi:hypothetical protein
MNASSTSAIVEAVIGARSAEGLSAASISIVGAVGEKTGAGKDSRLKRRMRSVVSSMTAKWIHLLRCAV